MWESFFKEMEKRAFGFGPAMLGAFTVSDINTQINELKKKSILTPPNQIGQAGSNKLQPANSYQFEGGKYTNMKDIRSPYMSLYS